MKLTESKIDNKGRTTVPPEIRQTFGLITGTRLDWQALDTGGLLVHVKTKLGPEDGALDALADAANAAADRAGEAIDDALGFIAASNSRIAAFEEKVDAPKDSS